MDGGVGWAGKLHGAGRSDWMATLVNPLTVRSDMFGQH